VFRPCLLIPIYNHGATICAVVDGLADLGLPCLVIDDGSDDATREQLVALSDRDWVDVHRLPTNLGRGGALQAGYRRAAGRGFTHAVQLDADGQHDAASVPAFLAEAAAHPEAMILGAPVFDASAPKARLYGRRLTQWWVWIETLGRDIRDPLCGFRCFPLAPTIDLLDRVAMGAGMEFDAEIVVRLLWDGVPVRNVSTPVCYFEDGLSTFRPLHDNLRISWLHTRLFIGSLPRLPWLLQRRRRRSGSEVRAK
jgi:glycosyltransferase involved in cell wall biosynthesis